MRKVVISGMIGNALEWYDYALYAQFSAIIAATFFPESSYAEIWTFAVFAAGFVVRPVGGILFGQIGDRFGRRIALVIGILMMAIPTAGIGLLPSYDSVGVIAPVILVIIRLAQGFSLGGEFSGCIAYIVEHSPAKSRGLAGSSTFVSMCLGMMMGLIVANLFRYFLTEEDLVTWGWRVPFVMGLGIGLVGMYIRTHLSESPLYKAAKAKGALSRTPLRETLTSYWREVLMAVIIYINVTAPFYTTTVFIKEYMINLGYEKAQGSFMSSIILAVLIVTFPISAYISDRIGRKPILVWSSVALVVSIYPIFLALHTMNYGIAILSQVIFSAIVGAYMGPVPTLLVELFPTKVRFTGVAISYNLSAAIFGGTAPMVGALLHKITGEQISLAYYLTVLAAFTLACLRFCKETYKSNLSDESIHPVSGMDEVYEAGKEALVGQEVPAFVNEPQEAMK